MNKAQQYMIKNGAFSNASGNLSGMEQTLSTLLAEKKALENKISGHELVLARHPENGAIKLAITIDTEKRETVIAQIKLVESAIESYKASPVHEQEQIVEDMQNQLKDTQTDLASQKKKYLMIGGLAVLVIGLYIIFKK